MLVAQGGVCAICRLVPEGNLHVDHSHTTGCVRGLLCRKCNTAIGLLQDDPQILKEAAIYLTRSSSGAI
ncbi:endonuclease VII domain-containing protein [Azospirillum himalayense]|uniref:Endonuclease VII domain-containing protein n=1 Tax=Azospirillum himalayense TaxID=654847 RepID=A0ABW0GJ25_9PROT